MERTKITRKETIGCILVCYIMLAVGFLYGFIIGMCKDTNKEEEYGEV
ncbi:MAG: hypothetical protein IKR19_07430 [Acholeplasmatales bacterium]|nr:hypothetical protein [Acholeplasmatales bacterium]